VTGLRAIGRRPTLWVELAVASAWLALVLGEAVARGYGDASGGSLASGPLWICTTGLGGIGHDAAHSAGSAPIAAAAPLAGTPMWGLMALAMMVPTAMPAVQHASGKSLYWRRRRAAAEFLLPFLALWTSFGVLGLGPLASWGPSGSDFALPIALGAAALWQLTPLKLGALRACHRSRPLPPRGWRASRGVADFALHNGAACLASCWAMMATAAVSGPGRLLWMGALTGAMTVEKLSEKPLTASRRLAALLAAAALGVAAAVLWG
jgi:predicted metal-binding membrane protein